jgi:hypothetical protein
LKKKVEFFLGIKFKKKKNLVIPGRKTCLWREKNRLISKY